MRTLAVTMLAVIANMFVASNATAGKAKPVMVFAFRNESGLSYQDYLRIGLAAALTEGLERAGFPVVCAPITDPAVIDRSHIAEGDMDQLNTLARSRGASYFIIGHFSGHPWKWNIHLDAYQVTNEGAIKRGEGQLLKQDLTVKRNVRTERINSFLASAAWDALWAANLSPSKVLKGAISLTSTRDSTAFIQWSRALAAHVSGDDELALRRARNAVNVDPAFVAARVLYASLLADKGSRKKARIHFQEALKRSKDDVRGLLALGRMELEEDDSAAAVEPLRRVAALRPRHPDVRYWLGKAYVRAENSQSAVVELSAARDLDPKHVAARQELAALFAKLDRFADAAKEYAAVLSLRPGRLDVTYAYAAVLRADRRLEQAVSVYAESEARHPQESSLAKFRGDLLFALGRMKESKQAYAKARSRLPADRRLMEMASGGMQTVVGMFALVKVIGVGQGKAQDAERQRKTFRLAANDVVMTLTAQAKRSCADAAVSAAVSSSYSAAAKAAGDFIAAEGVLLSAASMVKSSLRNREALALTPGEETAAYAVIGDAAATAKDSREISAQFRVTLRRLVTEYRCPAAKADVAAATVEELQRHNENRVVVLAPTPEPKSFSPITPQFPRTASKSVQFFVRAGSGRDVTVYVDDGYVGHVPVGETRDFRIAIGSHAVCFSKSGKSCGDNDWRRRFISDGFLFDIRNGR